MNKIFFKKIKDFIFLKDILHKNNNLEKKFYNQKIFNINNIKDAKNGEIIFFNNIKYEKDVNFTKASACITNKKLVKYLNKKTIPIISENPLLDFYKVVCIFYPDSSNDKEKIVNQKNKNILLKNGMSLEEYTVRMEVARDALAKQTLDKKAALKIFQQREFDISKQMFEEEVNARNEINSLIADAQLKGQILSAEDQRRVDINKALAQVIEQFAEKLTGPELLDAIRKLRQAMQGAAEASKDFGRNLARSFADAIKSTGDLANNLGSTLGNAFLSLGDQLAEFIATGKANFADFTSSVLMDMSKIFLRFAMFETLKALVPGSSALGKFLGFANGGIMTADGPMQLKRYAAGGIASSPQLAMFGEGSRPEAYVPLPDGRSIPVTMKGGGVGNVTVNVDAGGSNVEGNGPQANALGKAIGIAVQQELIKQKRPGGLLA